MFLATSNADASNCSSTCQVDSESSLLDELGLVEEDVIVELQCTISCNTEVSELCMFSYWPCMEQVTFNTCNMNRWLRPQITVCSSTKVVRRSEGSATPDYNYKSRKLWRTLWVLILLGKELESPAPR